MLRLFMFFIMVVLLIAGWFFSAENASDLTVNYFFNCLTMRSSYWILLIFVIGFVTGVIYTGMALVRARLANRRLRDAFAKQEAELQKMAAQLARYTGH